MTQYKKVPYMACGLFVLPVVIAMLTVVNFGLCHSFSLFSVLLVNVSRLRAAIQMS